MKKSIIAVAAVTTTIALGTAGVASASTTTKTTKVSVSTTGHTVGFGNNGIDPIASVLATLVSKGTITAAQSKAITDALAAARPAAPTPGSGAPSVGQGGQGGRGGAGGPGFGGPRGGFGGILGQDQSVILSTLGITAATLQSDLAAGKSLAAIAGTKTQALISAIVAAETTAINAQVTAGKLTQAQATTMISGLTARVTAEVNEVPGNPMGGHPMAPNGAAPAPSTTPSN